MREQLIQYVNRLFAGSTGAEDIQQEILQDTLEKYDDLVAQGVSSEEAYRQAAESVGDVQALLDELKPQAGAGGAGDSVKVNPVKVFRSENGKSIQIFVGKKGKNSANAQEFRPEAVDSLEIDWTSGSVVISAAQQDTITVREELTRGDDPMVVQCIGGKLSVKFSEKKNKLISKDKDLFITVPTSWSGKRLQVTTVSADVKCMWLAFADAAVDSASGDSDFDNCRLETLRVNGASGDITYNGSLGELNVHVASGDLSFTGSLETLKLDAASGDAEVEIHNQPRKLSFNLVSGDVDLTLPADCGFTLKRSSLTGDFHSDFDTSRSFGFTLNRSKPDKDFHVGFEPLRSTYGSGDCQIQMNSVSGDVSIHKGN